jgi:hypothetical protein
MPVAADKMTIHDAVYELSVRAGNAGYYGAFFCPTCHRGFINYEPLSTVDEAMQDARRRAVSHAEEVHTRRRRKWKVRWKAPRFTLSTMMPAMMFCTAVLMFVTPLCMSLKVVDYEQWNQALVIGTHPPNVIDLAWRLMWAWPAAMIITFGAVWVARAIKRHKTADPPEHPD